MAISLILVPLTIDYLSKETYGTWLTISSIVTMLTFFDIGIGNGLRNKLAEAVSRDDKVLARSYVTTAYVAFGWLQAAFIVLFILGIQFVPWQRILNTTIDSENLQRVVLIAMVSISAKLVLDILSYVLFALQRSGLVSLINFVSNSLILAGTYTLTKLTQTDMSLLAIVTFISPIVVLLVASVVLYIGPLQEYRPALALYNKQYIRDLLSLGYKFFVIQMAVIVLFYTDNLVITQLFGPGEVTTYNVAFRYFNAINTIFIIAITPYWSAFTEAFVKNDRSWMNRTYRHLQKLWLGLVILVVVMILVADVVYAFWVSDRVVVPKLLSVTTGLFVVISCWNNVTVAVVNGVGKVRLQLYYSLASAALNIPLAILFGKYLQLGSAGVMLATSLSLSIGSVVGGLQAKKILNGTAYGLWNK
ncbi:O-antigen export protein [Spirosoma luteolum]